MEPGIWPDVFNKFSQLTPWVQAVALACVSITLLGTVCFIKETIAILRGHGRNDSAEVE